VAPIAPLLKEYASEVSERDPKLLDSVIHAERVAILKDLKQKGYKVGLYTDNHGPVASLLISAIEYRMQSKFDWVKTGSAEAGEAKQKNLFDIEELFNNGEPCRIVMYDDRPKEQITHDSERHIVKRMSPRFNTHYDATTWAENAGLLMTSKLLDECEQYYAAEQQRWNAE